jgi:hypothetical protein
MRELAGLVGALLVLAMLAEFVVTFLLPRRVRRDPRIGRGLTRLLWRPWRAVARRLRPSSADTLLGLFGPVALLMPLLTWALGILFGYALLEWAVAGGSFSDRILFSSGLFLSAGATEGSYGVRVVELLEAATGVGVLFIVIGYLPAVYSAFSRRETAVSQLAARAGAPPCAGVALHQAIGKQQWQELKRDLEGWEEWAAELMETHLSYPQLAFYRSQHVNQNWLAALTAMVDVAAFIKATAPDDKVRAADLTYAIGRHAFADLATQFRLQAEPADRLSDTDFDTLYAIVEAATDDSVEPDAAKDELAGLRGRYEPNAEALARFLALELPPWVSIDLEGESVRKPGVGIGSEGRDLVG